MSFTSIIVVVMAVIVITAERYRIFQLQLAVYADQGLWDGYVKIYGDEAESQLKKHVDRMVEVANYNFDMVEPKCLIIVAVFEVWKSQPQISFEAKLEGNIDEYMHQVSNSIYNAENSKVDHVVVISGYRLTLNNQEKTLEHPAGYTELGTMCTGVGCTTILNGLPTGTSNGKDMSYMINNTLSQQLGIAFGLKQDPVGDNLASCPEIATWDAGIMNNQPWRWSECSIKRYADIIEKMDGAGTNCLNDQGSQRVHCRFEWTEPWTACSESCGAGWQHRKRTIIRGPINGGKACAPDVLQYKTCRLAICDGLEEWLHVGKLANEPKQYGKYEVHKIKSLEECQSLCVRPCFVIVFLAIDGRAEKYCYIFSTFQQDEGIALVLGGKGSKHMYMRHDAWSD